jgi:hypothetical protein
MIRSKKLILLATVLGVATLGGVTRIAHATTSDQSQVTTPSHSQPQASQLGDGDGETNDDATVRNVTPQTSPTHVNANTNKSSREDANDGPNDSDSTHEDSD